MVIPDRDVVLGKLAEAGKRPHRVEVIVENADFHWRDSILDQPAVGPNADAEARHVASRHRSASVGTLPFGERRCPVSSGGSRKSAREIILTAPSAHSPM